MTDLTHLEELLNLYAVGTNTCVLQGSRTVRLYGDWWYTWGEVNTDLSTIASDFRVRTNMYFGVHSWAPVENLLPSFWHTGLAPPNYFYWYKWEF